MRAFSYITQLFVISQAAFVADNVLLQPCQPAHTHAHALAGCTTQLKAYDQCGGSANCQGSRCGDNVSRGLTPNTAHVLLSQPLTSCQAQAAAVNASNLKQSAIACIHTVQLLTCPQHAKYHELQGMLLILLTNAGCCCWCLLSFCCPQVWKGHCCPSNNQCVRGNEFYYQCLPKAGASNAANAPKNAATNAPAPVAGNPPTDAVIAAPAQEPAIVAPPEKPVAAKMKGGGSHTSHELSLWLQ